MAFFFISCEQLKEGIALTALAIHSCPGMGANVSIFYIITNGVRNTLWAESDEILCIQFSNIFITFISTFRNYFSREKGHIKIMTSFVFINLLVRWKCHDLGWFKNFDAKKYCIFNFRWHPFRSLLCNVLHNLNICFSLLSVLPGFRTKGHAKLPLKFILMQSYERREGWHQNISKPSYLMLANIRACSNKQLWQL